MRKRKIRKAARALFNALHEDWVKTVHTKSDYELLIEAFLLANMGHIEAAKFLLRDIGVTNGTVDTWDV